ncbi:hypothetical protein [Pseudonocardia parietis]|uniref:MarR family transcriptional regulator n=1 Tax=Pseudonocardia parietis TaxID=570936 RepID=A0ABS4VX44_9PSEU|nr:hypothetical protein [Pseudonocardia parietis]MBP2368504.1 hypothetical protein [Pseudonocardia parietis]
MAEYATTIAAAVGKIVERWSRVDDRTLLTQIGAMPANTMA